MAVHKTLPDSELHDVRGAASAGDNAILQTANGSSFWTTSPFVHKITANTFELFSPPFVRSPIEVMGIGYNSLSPMPLVDPTGTGVANLFYEAVSTSNTVIVGKVFIRSLYSLPEEKIGFNLSFTDTPTTGADSVVIRVYGIKPEFANSTYSIVESDTTAIAVIDLTEQTQDYPNKIDFYPGIEDTLIEEDFSYIVVERLTDSAEDTFPYPVTISTPYLEYKEKVTR